MKLLFFAQWTISVTQSCVLLVAGLYVTTAFSVTPGNHHGRPFAPTTEIEASSVCVSSEWRRTTIPSLNDDNRAPSVSRRASLISLVSAFVITSNTAAKNSNALALDIDSFIQTELNEDTCNEKKSKKCKPNLTEDEALCRFGQPSQKTGEACLRAGMSTQRPTGVDAFGKVDRGNFVRCKPNYVEDPKNPGFLTSLCHHGFDRHGYSHALMHKPN
ncbi:hypothetical protein IV203_009844 [Nitzschia inconspicua]|uniref:Uncharacterized protein n=1 Tax=Nitzschia inconspicua TaxID=303405 RepID=A0A9K3KW78_9STRA|nr:hypothetical protein IV203_009844 [Nitzschia inconspicua]